MQNSILPVPLKAVLTFLSTCVLCINLHAAESEIKPEMHQIHLIVENLFPLAAQTKGLKNREKEEFDNSVRALITHVSSLEKHKPKQSVPFQISLDMLKQHLQYTLNAAEHGEYSYAVSLVKELPLLCSTCHTQDEQISHFDSSKIKAKLDTDFERGEYHFMTRDYQEALLDFNDHLAKQKKIRHGQHNREAMEKILLIYLNIFKDPQNALVYFKRLFESEKLNNDIALDVNHWLYGLEAIQLDPYQVSSITDIEKAVNSTLSYEDSSDVPIYITEKKKVAAVWLRGLIYDFIQKNPKHKDMAKILYWLASMESALEFGIYYQLPETYLKACVTNYPKHPYAKKCLSQYEAQITFDYTGSSGTHIPEYKQQELESLKKKLNLEN